MSRSAMSAALVLFVLAALFVAAPVSKVMAAETVSGKIVSVDSDNHTFVLQVGDDKVTVTVNDDTKYTINGEAAGKDDVLVAGAAAKVTHTDGVASDVAVTKE
ncbi:MAG: hypothetical protein GC162_15140 [Planctomycetes bacterium]|nr:hypothetical protein [Planctomycetota bacterium]